MPNDERSSQLDCESTSIRCDEIMHDRAHDARHRIAGRHKRKPVEAALPKPETAIVTRTDHAIRDMLLPFSASEIAENDDDAPGHVFDS
nr:hypothetical protein CFP56_03708 [Quercus suber]